MPKLLIKATELVGTDVERIALVNRGANRLPFRLTKSEGEEMLDLAKAGSFLIKTERKPGVAAAVVAKTADLEAVKTILKDAGLSVEQQEEKDGLIVFKQDGVEEYEQGMLKVSDDIGLVISGISKSFDGYDFNSTTFGEVFKSGSFYPSVRVAQDMLYSTISNIMYEAKDPGEAASMLQKANDEFNQYITALAGALPVHAFKADVALAKADDAKKKAKPEDKKDGKTAETQKSEQISQSPTHGNQPNDSNNGAVDNNIEKNPAEGNATPSASGGKQAMASVTGTTDNNIEGNPVAKTEEEGKKDESPKADDLVAAVLAGVQKALDTKFSGLEKSVDEKVSAISADMKTVNDTVAKVQAQVAKAEEAITGTVTADPNGDKAPVTKTDSTRKFKGAPPPLDTGYMSIDEAA